MAHADDLRVSRERAAVEGARAHDDALPAVLWERKLMYLRLLCNLLGVQSVFASYKSLENIKS